ncbi:hypothetical protein AMECASPLE_035544 [Ameca splendens]|uniref:Uncharacterized protein n=1 Tax=Ameca splendens TaxID=208324 RepID=A0ABV1A2S6_9TELE
MNQGKLGMGFPITFYNKVGSGLSSRKAPRTGTRIPGSRPTRREPVLYKLLLIGLDEPQLGGVTCRSHHAREEVKHT